MGWLLVIAVVAGCGRIEFDHIDNDAASLQQLDALGDGAAARWTLVQTVGSSAATLTIAPTGAGSLIVVAIQTSSSTMVTSITDDAPNGGNTYVAVPLARATNTSPADGLEIWYAKNARAGASHVVVTASLYSAAALWEVSGIRTESPLDTATTLDDQAASTTPSGPIITTSASGEFIVAATIVANGVLGAHAGNAFTNDHRTLGNGWAHLTDPAVPPGSYQAEWDQSTSGTSCAAAAAFFVGP